MDLLRQFSVKQEYVIEDYLAEAEEQQECVNDKWKYHFHQLNGKVKQEHNLETEANMLCANEASNKKCTISIKSEEIKMEPLGNEQLDIKDEPISTSKDGTLQELYSCLVCGYKTAGKYRFKQHVNIHEGHKPFKCYECKFATARKSNLRMHMNVHIREELHQCEQCEYRTIWKHYLRKHARSHNEEKPFKCEVCDYRTRWKHNMPVHMSIHVGRTPFKCSQCGYTVAQKKQLQHHLKSHQQLNF